MSVQTRILDFLTASRRSASICVPLAAVLACHTSAAAADTLTFPSHDTSPIRALCGAGRVMKVKGDLDAALNAWRLKPGVHADLNAIKSDVAAIVEKISATAPNPEKT